MESKYLTIAQAATHTGKGQATIRRIIKSLLMQDPNTPHVRTEQLANGSHKYYIEASHLTAPAKQADTQTATQIDSQTQALIDLLRQEIEEKNHQIANFQERDREHNVLIKGLHQRLLMIEAPRNPEPEPEPQPAAEPLKKGFFWQRPRRKFGKDPETS